MRDIRFAPAFYLFLTHAPIHGSSLIGVGLTLRFGFVPAFDKATEGRAG